VFFVRGPCQEDMREYGNGNGLEFLSSKGTAVWPEEELEDLVCDVTCAVVYRYWGGGRNLVRILQFLCYKSAVGKWIVKTMGNTLTRLVWSDCKVSNSAIV
jgi:hypothetical protein